MGGQTHTMRPIVEKLGDRVLASDKRQKVSHFAFALSGSCRHIAIASQV